jgi:two-component system, OmpR family, response regulator ChvI
MRGAVASTACGRLPVASNVANIATRRRVYVVDDDALFRESLERNLADAGFAVTGFSEGARALEHIGLHGAPALIVLDWRMPGMTGIEMLRRLRETNETTPVIFLTALSDQIYEEAALIGGAVDFVEKTRSFSILLRRIELALGTGRSDTTPSPVRGEAPAASSTSIGPLELAIETARAQWKGAPVDLTLSEFNIVRYLAERAGQDVRYREIYDLVRGKGFVAGTGMDGYRANVRTFIKRIRQKFREVDPEFDAIENYAGFGYRWTAGTGESK